MTKTSSPVDSRNVNEMPPRIRAWLNERGITDEVIADNRIFYDTRTRRIGIPIRDHDNMLAFHKYRRDPEDSEGPKYSYDRGARAMLFGARLLWKEGPVIICEGEFDAMLLESKGFIAVTSTGGAFTFREEWLPVLAGKEIFICLDNDQAGQQGTLKIARMIPHAKVMVLPGVGAKGDVTDWFKMEGNDSEGFRMLMSIAEPLPPEPEAPKTRPKRHGKDRDDAKLVPLSNFMKLPKTGATNVKCPFHEDGTSSFHWYRKDNRWWCFGGCGGGDVIDFVMRKEGLTMPEAIKKILM